MKLSVRISSPAHGRVSLFRNRFSREEAARAAAARMARQRSQVSQRGGCSSPKYRRGNTLRRY